MTAAISTQQLTRRFGRTVALSDVSLRVPEGAIYALVGANGAGKTTLIKVLMNIFAPSGGTAQVLGMNSRKVSGKVFSRIGYVSENQKMPDWMTVGEMLAYYRDFYPTWDRGLEKELVDQFDLPLGRKLKHLSRGMRMKAGFASSLAYRPALIVLDEPFSGLDPLVRDELVEGLIDRAPETTIFVSSHDLAEIESLASHVGFLNQGHLLFSEEMAILSAHFRTVTVTLSRSQSIPSNLPSSWLKFETSNGTARFVDSRYDDAASPAAYLSTFPAALNVAIDPMPLRAIFLAIARSARVDGELREFEMNRSTGAPE
jgi:ABC-type multidrug transport system, ATPase component